MQKSWKAACVLLITALSGFAFAACQPQETEPPAAQPEQDRALVAYFSLWDNAGQPGYADAHTSASVVVHNGQSVGTTGYIARLIGEMTDGELYPIRTEQTYPADRQSVEIYNRQSSARPALAGEPLDVETYDVVYLGYPIWNDQIPGAVYSFLERYDLSGKTIVPFCTYEEGTTDSTYAAIAAAEPEAEVIQSGFSILPEEMPEARAYLSVWLEGLLYTGGAAAGIGAGPGLRGERLTADKEDKTDETQRQ